MFEYSTVLGIDLRRVWIDQVFPFLDMLLGSPYFWPAVVVAIAAVMLLARLLFR